MKNREEILRLYNQQMRMDMKYPRFRKEVTDQIVRHISLNGEDGYVLYSNLNEENADCVIREQIEYFKSLHQRFEWKLYDFDQPANLLERLQRHGFEVGEKEALLILELEDHHPLLHQNIPANIEKISNPSEIDEMIAMLETVWEEPYTILGEGLKQDLEDDPEGLHIYVAKENGKIVSSSWMYLHKGTTFASFWGGSTLQEARGKGYYSSLIAVRAQLAWEKGYRFLTVDASPMSLSILQKKGFSLLGFTYPCMSPK